MLSGRVSEPGTLRTYARLNAGFFWVRPMRYLIALVPILMILAIILRSRRKKRREVDLGVRLSSGSRAWFKLRSHSDDA